jgi:hypothetical protein
VSVEQGTELLLRLASDPDLAQRLADPGISADDKRKLLEDADLGGVSCPDVQAAAASLDQSSVAGMPDVQQAAQEEHMTVAQLLDRAQSLAMQFCPGYGGS